MTDTPTINKALIAPVRAAMYDWTADGVRSALDAAFAGDAVVRMAHPLGDLVGPAALYDQVYVPLLAAVPDLERRDTIVMAGRSQPGEDWVGCCGYYTGAFRRGWLGIPPTGRQVAMRFHEFFRIDDGEVVEMHAVWDIPEVMMQADAWPMGPSLGRDWQVPGPATQDGIVPGPYDQERSSASLEVVQRMLADMGRHPQEPIEAMNLDRYWHPKFSWYGPAGIGTARGIDGFRRHHQIPFLAALPDRRGGYQGEGHFWADGDYVGVTGWPNMAMTVTGGGWLGIVPGGQEITMRSLDFWRVEAGLIRENWVLIDLLDVWDQLGVDVVQRMREFVHGRYGWDSAGAITDANQD